MSDVQVTCKTKPSPENRFERITHLGGPTWWWSVRDVIASIRNRTNTFFTLDPYGRRVDIRIVEDRNGAYVQTEANHAPTDNLLQLPECSM